MAESQYEKVFDLAKRRGFVYPAYELYGGAAGFYDYGPLGSQLKARLEAVFRQIYVVEEGAAEIATPAITVEPVLKASGHIDHFSDVVVTCKKCGSGFRADHFLAEEMDRIANAAAKSSAKPFAEAVRGLANEQIKKIKEHPSTGVAQEILHTGLVEDGGQIKSTTDDAGGRFEAGKFVHRITCTNCQGTEFDKPANFNLMFKTTIGPGTSKVGYLRPETAQAMFVDYPLLYRFFREKLPFSAVQIGRAYRNEISPRQGLIRLREFNQMECEAFFDPQDMTHPRWDELKSTRLSLVPNTTQERVEMTIGDAVAKKIVANAALGVHLCLVHRLLTSVGVDARKLRFRQHLKDEMAHYAIDCWDGEYESERFGWVECVGVADRGSYDLGQHEKHSGKPLRAIRRFDQPRVVERIKVMGVPAKLGPLFKKDAGRVTEALNALSSDDAKAAEAATKVDVTVDGRTLSVPREAYEVKQDRETTTGDEYIPRVIEPSYGQDRILYAILEHNLKETTKEGETYATLTLPADVAPVTVGVFPLMAKDGLDVKARAIERQLKDAGIRTQFDESGTIGRRYARADEIGTPWCVTIDYDTLTDGTVTLRDRDTTKQVRVPASGLAETLRRPSPRAGAA